VSSAQLATQSAKVVVVKSGLMPGGAGSDYAEYGLVLRNRSLTNDALNVTVRVEALDAQGRSFTSDETVLTLVPAATSFVVAGQLIWNVSINISRIKAVVHVGRALPRSRRLPPVRSITVSNYGQDVTASLTNPYKKPLPASAKIYGVFLDGSGRIIASGSQTTDAVVQPGQKVPFDLFGNPSNTAQASAVASAFVSVDPCGIDAFTSACPVPGASK
jgi:hypothetical protein